MRIHIQYVEKTCGFVKFQTNLSRVGPIVSTAEDPLVGSVSVLLEESSLYGSGSKLLRCLTSGTTEASDLFLV